MAEANAIEAAVMSPAALLASGLLGTRRPPGMPGGPQRKLTVVSNGNKVVVTLGPRGAYRVEAPRGLIRNGQYVGPIHQSSERVVDLLATSAPMREFQNEAWGAGEAGRQEIRERIMGVARRAATERADKDRVAFATILAAAYLEVLDDVCMSAWDVPSRATETRRIAAEAITQAKHGGARPPW